jgi:hypothetical protein
MDANASNNSSDSNVNSNQETGAQNNSNTPRQHEDATRVTMDSSNDSQQRVVGPFAQMVNAFISSFRQASQNERQAQSNQARRRTSNAAPPPLVGSQSLSSSSPAATATAGSSRENAATSENITTQPVPSVAETTTSETTSPSQQGAPNPSAEPASTTPANDGTNEPPRVLYFRMPFLTADGQSATLAFNPGPIPVGPTPVPANQPEARPPQAAAGQQGATLGTDRGNGLASGFHLPTAPIFVPVGASPLPFSFIFDVTTNTAWPIGAVPASSENDAAAFAAGPPFHIGLNISFGPAPQAETPDPDRASRFVDSLERADAELRERMAQLGMGAIGDYGGRQDNEGGEGALGCGICLDEYPSEDRPEWIGGQAVKDEEVVAVPCAGHHTLHRRCLYEWLAKTPPSEWTCPFCRAGLDRQKVENSAANAPARNSNDDAVKKAEQEAKARSLREEVRLREKARGWRCDSPACLLRLPSKDANEDHQSDEIIPLLPCRHQLHLDCLCTSMRLEQADAFEVDSNDGDDEDDEQVDDIMADPPAGSDLQIDDSSAAKNTVGKWVTCPTCRAEAWAELPMKKRRAMKDSNVIAAAIIDEEEESSVEQHEDDFEIRDKLTSTVPTHIAREVPLLRNAQRSARVEDAVDEDSDGIVETILL